MLNVVPFENEEECTEIVQRGLDLVYMLALSQPKVCIRFRSRCHGRRQWVHHLRVQNIGEGVEHRRRKY